MASSSRSDRRRRAREWQIAVALAVALVGGVALYAAYDVLDQLRRPSVSGAPAEQGTVSTQDPRRQVLVRIVVTSDGPFGVTYLDAEGQVESHDSVDGRELTLEVTQRGLGPYLQVWAQTSPQASFIRCRIEVDDEEEADERVEGAAAQTYCAA